MTCVPVARFFLQVREGSRDAFSALRQLVFGGTMHNSLHNRGPGSRAFKATSNKREKAGGSGTESF
jgi:hypothetical protein